MGPRFTDIDYRPRPDESDPQWFDYATDRVRSRRRGHGESTGEARAGGVRVENDVGGRVVEYEGRFDVEWIDCETVPDDVRSTTPTRGE